jgi:hypothetical protein
MTKADQRFVIALAVVVIAGIALSDPGCNGGCRTLAENVFNHGISALLA